MEEKPDQHQRQRLTRAEAKARTRAMLLESAARVFARKGFAGASVEEIAESAGFSIGALYSNFGSKEALFLELMADRRLDRIAQAAETLNTHEAGTGEIAAELAHLIVTSADKDIDFVPLQAELWLYAVRNPHGMETMATALHGLREALGGLVDSSLAKLGAADTVSAESATTVVMALIGGLVRQRRIDPASVSEELFAQALRWLFIGMSAGTAPAAADE